MPITDEEMKDYDNRERNVIDASRVLAKRAREMEETARAMKREREYSENAKKSQAENDILNRAYGVNSGAGLYASYASKRDFIKREAAIRPTDIRKNLGDWMRDVETTARTYRLSIADSRVTMHDDDTVGRVEILFLPN